MSDISADAITAAAKVIHWLSCGECVYQPEELTAVSKRDREDAEQILTAAALALRASLYGSSDMRLAIEAARATGRQEERERTHGPTGISLIAAERSRQVSAEGYTPEHDAEHANGELTQAAICYAAEDPARGRWPAGWIWKPSADHDPVRRRVRDLIKAGALIAAEIDRLLNTP